MSNRCALRYQDPATLEWRDCGRQAPTTLVTPAGLRHVCSEHLDDYRRVERAGLLDSLIWADQPEPRRRRQRTSPGQLDLWAVAP
jgi:hypothetical protein